MSADSVEVIVVTGRRADGLGPTHWLFSATVNTYAGTNSSGGGGTLAGTRGLASEDELEAAIRALDSNDSIILRVPGMPPQLIDGKSVNGFFQTALNLYSTLMTAMVDGRIDAALGGLDASVRAFFQDLKNDLREAAAEGNYIRITNVSSLEAAIPGAGLDDEFDSAAALTRQQTDTSDYDRDPLTTGYHQIYINSSRADRLGDPAPGSRIPTTNGVTI